MQDQSRRTYPGRKSAIALLVIAAVALCAFQFGDRYGLNSMPFARTRPDRHSLHRVKDKVFDVEGIHVLAVDGLAQ